MGLFGNIFEKKNCSICGGEIGLLGNRKLEDGNLCKECANKLSPFFSERRHSTVEEIREQLDYREANKGAVESFQVKRVFNCGHNILIDEQNGNFIITRSRNWREVNPDVIPCSSITGMSIEQIEHRSEITYKDAEGNTQSYDPRRYEISYDFELKINVNHPYFDMIEVKLNDNSIDKADMVGYSQVKQLGDEIKAALSAPAAAAAEAAAAASAPKTAVNCPFCGATTIPDPQGRCEFCGGAVL